MASGVEGRNIRKEEGKKGYLHGRTRLSRTWRGFWVL